MSNKPQESAPGEPSDPKRRAFLKLLAAGTVAATVNGMLPASKEEHSSYQQRVARAEADVARLAPELASYDTLDVLGASVFLGGVRTLSKGDPINKLHYGALGALIAAKYQRSTPTEKHHLTAEIESNFKALGVIAGTIAIGDGLKMDLTQACESLMEKSPDASTEVALLNMFSTFVAPVVTTVGNASIISQTANKLAGGDKDFRALSVGHSSGRAGYLLFGDPPFLAMIDRYGFKEAITWQFTHMLPLALYSLVSTTMKMNYNLAKRAGSTDPWKEALAQTVRGIKNNIPYLVKIITASLGNAVKYFTGGKQDLTGVEMDIGNVIAAKLKNLFRLPWDKGLDESSIEDFQGIIDIDDQELRSTAIKIASTLNIDLEHQAYRVNQNEVDDPNNRIANALIARDFDTFRQILLEHGMDAAKVEEHVANCQSQLPQAYRKTNDVKQQQSLAQKVRNLIEPILKVPARSTDMHRVKKALGHNIGDILNVFPFQANCVPFLLPLLKTFVHKMEALGLSELQREIAIFLIVMVFSMFADNYVAVKMGLDLTPNKPQIPLIAGIEGGQLTAIGNMANMAQFSSDAYSLKDSLERMHLAIDNVGIGMVYALALGTSSLRPTSTDLAIAKVSAKGFIDQVFGNPVLEDVTQTLLAA